MDRRLGRGKEGARGLRPGLWGGLGGEPRGGMAWGRPGGKNGGRKPPPAAGNPPMAGW